MSALVGGLQTIVEAGQVVGAGLSEVIMADVPTTLERGTEVI